TVGWVSDGKDSAINPTRGTYQKAAFEISPGGDLRYYKATYQHQRFFPVSQKMVLMLNGEAGYAKGLSGQEMPFFKNFYAGGVGSVRGYDTASLGPYELDSSGDEVRLGGTRRYIFNAELTMPVPGFGADKSMRFGPFFDAGQVTSDEEKRAGVYDSGPVRMSVGLAATWLSPMGPLKFSLAQPLNKQKSDNIQIFQFQMGTMF
ncbi:MAG: BamA/TamA family outer membrane protein, partial [Propionivibrio sp.]